MIVGFTYAIVQPLTVVVEGRCASVTLSTMLGFIVDVRVANLAKVIESRVINKMTLSYQVTFSINVFICGITLSAFVPNTKNCK